MTPDPAETLKLLPESTPVLRFVYISVTKQVSMLHSNSMRIPTDYPTHNRTKFFFNKSLFHKITGAFLTQSNGNTIKNTN